MDLSAATIIRLNYLLVRVRGEFSLARAKQIITASIQKSQQYGLNEILYDIRLMDDMDPPLSTIAATRIGNSISCMFPMSIGLALLVPPDKLKQYKFAERIMRKKGSRVLCTADCRRALRWLWLERTNVSVIDLENRVDKLKKFVSFDVSASVPELN